MGNQPKHDMQAGWHVKKDSRRNLKSTYGYFVDTIADENNFIQRQTVTVVSVHDCVEAIRSCISKPRKKFWKTLIKKQK